MDLTRLAARQKRAKDWADFIDEGGVHNDGLRAKFQSTLKTYREALAEIWESQSLSELDETRLSNLERELVQLSEEARIRVVGRKSVGA